VRVSYAVSRYRLTEEGDLELVVHYTLSNVPFQALTDFMIRWNQDFKESTRALLRDAKRLRKQLGEAYA